MGEWMSFGRCMLPGVATAVHWSQCTMNWGKWCKILVQLWLPKWMAHRMSISGLRWDSLAHCANPSAEFSLWSSFFLHAENLEFHGNLSETEPETSHQNSRNRTKFHANCEHRKSLIPHCSTQDSPLWISLQTCNPCWKVLTHNLNLAQQRLLKSDADIHGNCRPTGCMSTGCSIAFHSSYATLGLHIFLFKLNTPSNYSDLSTINVGWANPKLTLKIGRCDYVSPAHIKNIACVAL